MTTGSCADAQLLAQPSPQAAHARVLLQRLTAARPHRLGRRDVTAPPDRSGSAAPGRPGCGHINDTGVEALNGVTMLVLTDQDGTPCREKTRMPRCGRGRRQSACYDLTPLPHTRQ
jgi:hypothetical protein